MPKVRALTANEDYDECEELLENIQNGYGRTNNSALILRVNEYIKKPVIEHDLTGILNTYLNVLYSSEMCIRNGIFNTNFAEAALLLQGAATLYSKKVDLLWDFVVDYLNRNMSYEEKTEENMHQFEALEELKVKNKRRRKALEDNNDDESTKPKRKLFIVDKSAATVQGMTMEELHTFVSSEAPSPNICKQSDTYTEIWKDKSSCNMEQLLENKIQCGRTNVPDENSIESRLTRNLDSVSTNGDIPPINFDLHETNIYGEKEPMGDYGGSSIFDQINREFNAAHRRQNQEQNDIPEFVLQNFLTEKSMHIDQAYKKFDEFLAECHRVQEHGSKACNESFTSHVAEDGCHDMFDSMSMNGLDESALSMSPPPPCKSLLQEDSVINKELGSFMEKRNDSVRKTFDSDLESGVFDGSNRSSPLTQDGLRSDEDCLGTPKKLERPLVASTPLLEETIIEEVVENCKRIKKSRLFSIDEDKDEDDIPKRKKPRKVKEKLRPTTTADLKAFNKFFCQHYNPAEGEGAVDNIDDYSDDEELGDLPDFHNDEDVLSSASPISKTPAVLDNTFDSGITSLHTNDVSTTLETEGTTSFADFMEQDASSRFQHVLEWKKFITEKIGNQKKSDFDIHVEETHLIESIGDIGKVAKYQDICSGKTSAAVSHNFIAMLHLANTGNVSLMGVEQGQLSNGSLHVKLCSKDRHHEHLDEYNNHSSGGAYDDVSCNNHSNGLFV